jgi:hypothetical protein
VSYNLKDVSAAMYKAERKEGLSLDAMKCTPHFGQKNQT